MRKNTFYKMNLVIFLLLIPINAVYWYSNQVSVNVVSESMQSANLNKVVFFQAQLENNVNQMAKFLITLSRDPNVKSLQNLQQMSPFEQSVLLKTVSEKLSLQSVASNFNNSLMLYLPRTGEKIGAGNDGEESDPLAYVPSEDWYYRKTAINRNAYEFVKYIYEPYLAGDKNGVPEIVLEMRFSPDNIVNMLNDYKLGGKGDPFFYHPDYPLIVNRTAERPIIEPIAAELRELPLGPTGNRIMTLQDGKYLVNYAESKSLGWYLVDYTPLDEVLSPITRSRNLFYVSILLLLITGLSASFLLYRNVQLPLKHLIRGVQQLKYGNYAARIRYRSNNEFDYLNKQFNEMAGEIEDLIEKVYKEKLYSREATLKQLQSQINPHFLYNCLFFVQNMARSGDVEAVEAMALNLASYFRYTTRLENQLATVREEIELVGQYLTIQNLRNKRMRFEIAVPEAMMTLAVPRLLLQPIVENSVLHGIEPKPGPSLIRIYGEQDGDECRLIVEDDGVGISDAKLTALRQQLLQATQDGIGCALWNVHWRLVHRFGGESGLELAHAEPRGVRVLLRWMKGENE
ncbi:sensor histidine kinase [Paenibacillus cymbidii]|uniref:sensor histidine kinase n=1 Tax=Paenibacillus cymbidii TaxID=1639034 RepID=UPI0010816840|nr:sensor histidine kinase [Paenibacillus cymbidii]